MAASDPSHALEKDPIAPLLLRYSLPAIVAMTVTSLYNIISSIYIGHGVGALAISGLAVTFPLMNLIMAVCLLVAVGGSTVSSIELGRKNTQGAMVVLGHVLVLEILFAVIFGVVSLLFLRPILTLFGASAETMPYAYDFMQVLLLGLPVGYAMLGLSHMMRATGYPVKSMLSVLITVGCNIVLTPLFIFVLPWGMRGAAVATVLSQCVGLVWILAHFCGGSSTVHFAPGLYRLRPAVVRGVLAIGMPPFLMNTCACLVVVIINNSLYRYGGDLAIGAYGIMNRLIMLFVMVVMGLAQGMQPIVGYNFGARKPGRVQRTLVYGVVWGTLITTAGFLVFEFLPGPLTALFTTDTGLTGMAVTALRLGGAVFFLVGGQIIISAFFQSIGMPAVSIFLSLTRQLLFLIPGLLILPRFLHLSGVWISLPVADCLAFVVTLAVLWKVWIGRHGPRVAGSDRSADSEPSGGQSG
ncbi:MAG: MATE family efflux transporter [Desulfovibrionaceae bacterium]|nr:MATE family efflux transporter [Desulfovibrionaceae bacterium]